MMFHATNGDNVPQAATKDIRAGRSSWVSKKDLRVDIPGVCRRRLHHAIKARRDIQHTESEIDVCTCYDLLECRVNVCSARHPPPPCACTPPFEAFTLATRIHKDNAALGKVWVPKSPLHLGAAAGRAARSYLLNGEAVDATPATSIRRPIICSLSMHLHHVMRIQSEGPSCSA